MFKAQYQMASGEWRELPEAYPDALMAEKAARAVCVYWRVVEAASGELAVAGMCR